MADDVTTYNGARDEDFRLSDLSLKTALPLTPRVLPHDTRFDPKLDFREYIHPDAPTVPPAVHRELHGYPWGMLLNDQLGDCGEAMACHAIEAFRADAGMPHAPFTDADAEKMYEDVGGYDPSQTQPDGSNPTDQGTDNSVLISKWSSPGFHCAANGSTHRIAAAVEVPVGDDALAKRAIWEFVVLFEALGLPMNAQGAPDWTVRGDPNGDPDAGVGSWGYHDVPNISYDPTHLLTVSWGSELTQTWPFKRTYGVQTFFVVTYDQLGRKGVSPSGVNLSKLMTDARKIAGA